MAGIDHDHLGDFRQVREITDQVVRHADRRPQRKKVSRRKHVRSRSSRSCAVCVADMLLRRECVHRRGTAAAGRLARSDASRRRSVRNAVLCRALAAGRRRCGCARKSVSSSSDQMLAIVQDSSVARARSPMGSQRPRR